MGQGGEHGTGRLAWDREASKRHVKRSQICNFGDEMGRRGSVLTFEMWKLIVDTSPSFLDHLRGLKPALKFDVSTNI